MEPYPRRLLHVLVGLLCAGALTSCSIWDAGRADEVPAEALGMRPVYFAPDSANVIFSDAPRALQNGTGVVTLDDLLFVIDQGLGVHLFDNRAPSQPVALAFIHIPGIATLTATPGRLYANNFGDLVTIDIEDPRNARVIDRDAGLFRQPLDFPEGFIGFFECYDPARGRLIRWEEATVTRPECRINF